MKVLIVTLYFWPEYFRINDLVEELKNKGFKVDILTGYPNYPSGNVYKDFRENPNLFRKFKDCDIYRIPIIPRKKGSNINLVINYFSFLFSSIFFGVFKLKKKEYDFIVTYATSPITVALTGIFFSKIKSAKHVIWVQDLWPNVLSDLKIIEVDSFIYYVFKIIVKFIYKKSDLILCQSLQYKKEVIKYEKDLKDRIVYYPSWPEDINFENTYQNTIAKNNLIYDKSSYNILFAGNIGESQNFNFVIDLIKCSTKKNITWHIIGEGRNFQYLKEQKETYNLNNLKIYGLMSFGSLQYYLNNADSLLISLKYNSTFKATIPGKFQTYLKYKKPIFGLLGGETSSIINKYKIGLATKKDNDQEEAEEILNKLMTNQTEFKKENYSLLLKIFSKKRAIKRLIVYFKNILNKDFIQIKLLKSSNEIPFDRNFIISGLNLAFLAFYYNKNIVLNDSYYLWPDGFFKKKFFPLQIKKIPGRVFLDQINLNNEKFKRIVVLGNLDLAGKEYLVKKFKYLTLVHVPLPFGEVIDFIKYIPFLESTDICILTLPTPKQEALANYIRKTQSHYKIICIGGAINMLSGSEKPLPKLFENIFFAEAIWRLQFDTSRRIKRLIISSILYIRGEFSGVYNKIKIHE